MMRRGMNKHTGQILEGSAHLRQSIEDILTTPLGTRVGRRDYGSRLFELLDKSVDQVFQVELYAAVADALRLWEPDFSLERVVLAHVRPNGPVFDLHGVDLVTGRNIVLERI